MANIIKAKILVIGPTGCGKTRISNFLADATDGYLPPELRPTCAVRILEFDVENVSVKNKTATVEVQLWDCGGNERYTNCWPALRQNTNGIIFVYSPNDSSASQTLDEFYNYFVTKCNFSPKQCILLSHLVENGDQDNIQSIVKLSPQFARMSQSTVNLETQNEKLRYEFNQFLTTVVNTME